MYSVLRFKAVFHKIIEENCKKLCVEISYSYYKTLNNNIFDNGINNIQYKINEINQNNNFTLLKVDI